MPLSASDTETRAVVDNAVAQVRGEVEERIRADQTYAQAERERKQRESTKEFLVSVGVSQVAPYLSKLEAEAQDHRRPAPFPVNPRGVRKGDQ